MRVFFWGWWCSPCSVAHRTLSVTWKLPFPRPLPLSDLDLGQLKGTEWWAGIPIISKGPKPPAWLRQEAGKNCPASMKSSHLGEGRLQGKHNSWGSSSTVSTERSACRKTRTRVWAQNYKAALVSLQGEDLSYISHRGSRHLCLCKEQYPEPQGPLGTLLSWITGSGEEQRHFVLRRRF